MKSFGCGAAFLSFAFTLIVTHGFGQTLTNVPGSKSDHAAVGVWYPKPLDGFSTEWSKTEMVPNAVSGLLEPRVETYIAVASGLNYLDSSGAWQPSADQIDIVTNGMGGAAALRGPTQAYFPTTLGGAGDAVALVTASNTVIKIAPMAVYYIDDSGQSVLLAQMKPGVQGELAGLNQVVYRSVMKGGLNCDLRFTYTRGACEADLIINSQPAATPEFYSLDPASTRLELVSAVTAPLPRVSPAVTTDELPDINLDYDGGALQFVKGYAFSIADDTTDSSATPANAPARVALPNDATSDSRLPVSKNLIQMPAPGQWGLGESVRWKDIEPKLQNLPPYQQGAALSVPQKHASLQRQWPKLEHWHPTARVKRG